MFPATEAFIRSSTLACVRDILTARGLDFNALQLEAGLARGAFDDPGNELPLESVALLMQIAAERTNDPGLCLSIAEAYPPGAAGLYGYLIKHAGTIGEAMQVVARYAELVFHPSTMEYREEADYAALAWSFPIRSQAGRIQFTSFVNALLTLRLRRLAGRDWSPIVVEVEHPELSCPGRLNRIFGPRITFNARENMILVDRSTLHRPAIGSDPKLFEILQETADAKLNELAGRPDLVARTARAITDVLSTDPPLLERIAERMRMTPRSLQNRLAQHGTTFERVLSDTRRRLAERYLRETNLPLTEIAFLLGFSEQSAFTRAARAWFGRPPRQLRKENGWMARNGEAHKSLGGTRNPW